MSDRVIPEELYLDLLAFVKQMGLQSKLSFTHQDRAYELVQALSALPPAAALAPASSERAAAGDANLREGLTILLVSAQSAEAARLDQMHNHLDTGHPAAQTDGQAAQIHRLYVQAITQLLAPAPAVAE